MTTAEKLFDNIEFLYENIYNLLIGFQQANNGTNDIEVEIKKKTDQLGVYTTERIRIKSFESLFNELNRLQLNFNSLTNEDNISYLLNSDGSLSQITKTSFINAEYLNNFTDLLGQQQCIIDDNSFIKNLLFPSVKIPVELSNQLNSNIYCKIYEIKEGWQEILDTPTDELTTLKIKYLVDNGLIQTEEYSLNLEPELQRVKYFGNFSIIAVNSFDGISYNLTLNDVKYEGVNTYGVIIDLKVGDLLISEDGTAKFQITDINVLTKNVTVRQIAGPDKTLQVGVNQLYFNEVLPIERKKVSIPVRPQNKFVAFLSTKNHKNISYPSRGIKFDTSQYKVTYNNRTYTIDEFFNEKVTNFSSYFESLIKEQNIPYSLGLKPRQVKLDKRNFNVVQINKHITNEKTKQVLETLNIEKQKIKNKLEFTEQSINQLQNEVDTLKFKSQEEKNYRLEKIQTLRNEKNVLEQNLLTVTRNLDNNAIETGVKNIKPKYRVLGAWEHQNPLFSTQTRPQHIIKYDVQYRYLSKNVDIVENQTMKLITESGKEISFSYSPWINYESKSLNRIKDEYGNLKWETLNYSDTDEININQVSISINENESVEIRVRAVSEVGYPVSQITSDWSEILRIDFPQDIVENSITSVVERNNTDLSTAEFNAILKASGVLRHISQEIQEAEKLYFHKSEDIASGFFTAEQKNISLFEYLKSIQKDIDYLKNIDSNSNLTVEIVDFNREKILVKSGSTIQLFAGNYADTVNLIKEEQFGTIIKKQFMIRLRNSNNQPIEIKSLIPGVTMNVTTAPKYYNVGIRHNEGLLQKAGQIIYFRNLDVTNQPEEQFKLVKSGFSLSNTVIPDNMINNSVPEDQKNVIYYKNNDIYKCKLVDSYNSENFVAYISKNNPQYDPNNLTPIINSFKRLQKHSNYKKSPIFQQSYNSNDDVLGYDDIDFYAIGGNSCGAYLYPIIPNLTNISVTGNSTISTLVLQKDTEILIPVVFEYRMMDRLGNVDGIRGRNIIDDLEYKKKIGVDILINNQIFQFDVEVSAKLNPAVKPIEKLNVNSVTAQYVRENEQNLRP